MGLNKESRTINASKNASSAFLNKFVILLLAFISRRFFIRYIGVHYLGINGLFANILTLLAMADLGLGTAMNVSLYKPIAEGDTRKISALLNYFRRIYYVIAAAVMGIGLSLIPFLKYIVNMDQNIPHLYLYYVLFVAKSAISYLFVYKASIIKADQRQYTVNSIDVYVNIIKVVLEIIAICLFKNYLVYLLLEVGGVVAHNLVISYIADKSYPFIAEKAEIRPEEKKGIFTDVSSIFLYKIAYSLLNGTDNVLMSIIVGTIYVGLYSNYLTITHNLEQFIAMLFTSLTAGIGNLVATATPEHRYETYKAMQMVSFWICGIVSVCLLYLMQDFIVIWVGRDLLLDDLTMIAIVLNVFFSTCMRPVWTFREGTGMYKQIRYIMFATAILNLILSIVLGKIMGVSGILFATSISKLCTYFWYEPNILFRDFFHKPVSLYYREFLRNTILLAFCMAVCFIPAHFIPGTNIIFWLFKAIVLCCMVSVLYYFRYRRAPEFANIKTKAVGLIRKITGKFRR